MTALLEKRIRDAIDRVLQAKGYGRKLAGKPDFFVVYPAALKEKLDVKNMNSVYGFDPGWGWHHRGRFGSGVTGTGPYVGSYDSGTLIIDLLEERESTLIWRASAQTRVDLMLERFPRRASASPR